MKRHFFGDTEARIWRLGAPKIFKMIVLRAQEELGGPLQHATVTKITYKWIEIVSGRFWNL